MKRFTVATLLLTLLVAPGYAQQAKGPTAEEMAAKRKQKELDAGYQRALELQTATEAKPADPWGNVRPATPAASGGKK